MIDLYCAMRKVMKRKEHSLCGLGSNLHSGIIRLLNQHTLNRTPMERDLLNVPHKVSVAWRLLSCLDIGRDLGLSINLGKHLHSCHGLKSNRARSPAWGRLKLSSSSNTARYQNSSGLSSSKRLTFLFIRSIPGIEVPWYRGPNDFLGTHPRI